MSEYNYIKDFYLPIKDDEELYSSPEFLTLRNNNIDTAVLEGIDEEDGVGQINFKEEEKKLTDQDKSSFVKDLARFVFLDLPKDTIISIIRAGANGAQKGNSLYYAIKTLADPDGKIDLTNYKAIDKEIERIKGELDQAQEDSPFINRLLGVIPQDMVYTIPIYKKLKKVGVPNSYAFPIAMGAGTTLAFDPVESIFVDSAFIKNLKTAINVEPNTPEEDITNMAAQISEYTSMGALFKVIGQGYKVGKKIGGKDLIPQSSVAVGGGAATTGVAQKVQEQSDEPSENVENNIISQTTEKE
tara:strand:+ start:171 stop:1070 length:900 start_codon:yes stop_codon:yes gene_type:complete